MELERVVSSAFSIPYLIKRTTNDVRKRDQSRIQNNKIAISVWLFFYLEGYFGQWGSMWITDYSVQRTQNSLLLIKTVSELWTDTEVLEKSCVTLCLGGLHDIPAVGNTLIMTLIFTTDISLHRALCYWRQKSGRGGKGKCVLYFFWDSM